MSEPPSWIWVVGYKMILAQVLMFNRYLEVAIFSFGTDPQETAPASVVSPTVGCETTATDPALLSEFE
jgi:hypothetical protein